MSAKYIIFCLLLSFNCFSQTGSTQSVAGSIIMPSLLSLDVSNINASFNLSVDDLSKPKIIPNVCNVKINGNIPWVLGVVSSGSNFESASNGDILPVSMLSFKTQNTSTFYGLSPTPQAIAENTDDNVQTILNLDMKIAPLNSDFPGGTYSLVVFFIITAQ